MEIIGDPQVFAVQTERDCKHTYKPWMYGVFCVYMCGEILGSLTNQSTLNGILADLYGWKETIGERSDPNLMAVNTLDAFLSIEGEAYGFDHLAHMTPEAFRPLAVPASGAFEILGIDGLEDYKVFCIEDDITSRLIFAKRGELPRECRLQRAVLTDVLLRTIDTLDGWFQQLPEPPAS